MLGSAATLVGTGPAPPINAGGGVMVVDAAGARRPGAGGPSTTMRGGSERDPNVLSEYLQVEFDDVFAEPEGTYSLDGVWKAATLTFTHTKNFCYRVLSLLCAVPLALIVGISFACLSFQHIWCIGPAIRHCRVNCHVVRQYMRIILESCCAPCFSEMGLVLSRIRIQHLPASGNHVDNI
ncbi:caveolin-3-like [Haemaphysalis longicornis]